MTHELKTWPGPFEAVVRGDKTHEVRKADREFRVGDVLHLREWDPNSRVLGGPPEYGIYTGRECRVEVTHLTTGGSWGLPEDVCVMSIRKVTP